MGKLNPGLAAYLAKKKGKTPATSPTSPHPLVPMSPAMVTSIKVAPKGKIPPGLAKYLAAKKAKKGTKK